MSTDREWRAIKPWGTANTIDVSRDDGEEIAPSDVEWVEERLNTSWRTTATEALDVLEREAGELAAELPGLGAVVQVLRDQLAAAMLDRSAAEAAALPPVPRPVVFHTAAPPLTIEETVRSELRKKVARHDALREQTQRRTDRT